MTAMQMHPYYTEVPLRSFEAMAFEGNLSEVLLALIVDPNEAEDVSLTIQNVYDTKIELDFEGKIISAPITLEDFQNLPSKNAFEQLKITLSQWAMTKSSTDAIIEIARWDRRLGAWCACACSREGQMFHGEENLKSIAITEAWVRGEADMEEVKYAYRLVRDNSSAGTSAKRAAGVAFMSPAYFAKTSVDYAMTAVSEYVGPEERVERLFRNTISDACLTFPG